FYGCFTILVEIVLFNVISAMFVESTMEAAAHISNLKRRERLQDEGLLYTRIAILVRRIMIKATGTDPGQALTEHLDTIVRAQVPRETIDQVIYDQEAKQALMDLDINPLDH
ncbi:CACNA1B, partial [Symbiodinium microadriaticum]